MDEFDATRISQISLKLSYEASRILPADRTTDAERDAILGTLREALDAGYPSWHPEFRKRFSHSPLYVPTSHVAQIEALQKALNTARSFQALVTSKETDTQCWKQ